MIKLTVTGLVVLLSLAFVVQAQSDDSLIIENDIGLYKYMAIETPPLQENMERAQFAAYNSTSVEDNIITGIAFIIIEFKKLGYAEETLNKIKEWLSQGHTVNVLEETYKGSIIYLGKPHGQVDTRVWQSGKFIIVVGGPIVGNMSAQTIEENTRLYSPPKPLPEEILDAYLAKYPVNYFECPTHQTPPQGGYTYAPDYDGNGCISGYHLYDGNDNTLEEGAPNTNNPLEQSSQQSQETEEFFVPNYPTPMPEYPTPSQPVPVYPTQQAYPPPQPEYQQEPILEPQQYPTTHPEAITANIIKSEPDTGKIIQAAVKLANVKIILQELKNNIENVAIYYYNSGDQKKYNLWSPITPMFEMAINKVDEIVQQLKITKDVEGARDKIKELIGYVSQIADQILAAI